MNKNVFIFLLLIATFSVSTSFLTNNYFDNDFVSYTVNPKAGNIKLYWKDDHGSLINNFQNLKNYLEQKHLKLVFAMNGGMFLENMAPLGLYIENFKTIKKLNTSKGSGNFYMEPNGVFYIDANNSAYICKTSDFGDANNVKYATQSGPMLVIDGKINAKFTKGSKSGFVRNGVGLLPDGELLFAISKMEVNFYNFAEYFLSKGCQNALYLDGYVSKMYLPEKDCDQMDGSFGVIIGVEQKLDD